MSVGKMKFFSVCLNRQVEFAYVLPNDYPETMTDGNPYFKRDAKTLYLLHGVCGNDFDWLSSGNAEDLALRYNLNVILISAGNSFYLDRPATGCQYATYTGKEIVCFTRKVFGLSSKREDTLIGGLSMGGFGAIHTGLLYPETFGGIIALSSALIIHQIDGMTKDCPDMPANYAYYQEVFGNLDHLAETDTNPEVLYRKCKKQGRSVPPLYMAVGTEDFLYQENQKFRLFLESEQADFHYEEGAGTHNWDFWNQYIHHGLRYILGRKNVT